MQTTLSAATISILVAISVISHFGTVSSAAATGVVGKNCTNASTVCKATTHTVCDVKTQKCKCNVGYTGTIYNNCTAAIGIGCTIHTDCWSILKHSTCEANKCKCDIGYFGLAGDTCSVVVGGKVCANNTDCSTLLPHSVCGPRKTCACAVGFIGANCLDLSSASTALASIKTIMFIITVYGTGF